MTLDMVAPAADWDISTPELRKQRRKPVKNINFGLCYGMGQTKLANDLGLDARDGADLFRSYHTAVPFVKATYDSVSAKARDRGWIRTVANRRARFPLWEPRFSRREGEDKAMPYEKAVDAYDGRIVRAFTHKALNRLLQGSAADLMKKAMCAMWQAGLHRELGHMLLTCHDETGHSVPQTPAGLEAFAEVKHIMETCMVLRVPIRADQSTGPNWGACQ
jgi:DNA polymerase-1